MFHGLRRLVALSICCTLICACGPMSSMKVNSRGKSFLLATETYRKLVRWGAFEDAAKYIRGKTDPIPAPDLASYAHYKITAFSVGESLGNDTYDEARLVASIEYYDLDTGIAGGVRDEQYWWYDYEKQRWFLGSPMFQLGPLKSKR